MNVAEKNLEKYLEIETLLNVFFGKFNFCLDHCIKKELEKNGNRPVAACCKQKYYKRYDIDHPSYELLRTEREKRFGKPEDHFTPESVSPCEYHSPSGCILKTHKSPICLAFMCPESIEVLRATYDIYEYDYLGVNYALEWILTGDFTEAQFLEFRDSCYSMIQKVSKTS